MDGHHVTVDPEQYFFRFETCTWRICPWPLVRDQLLDVQESTEAAVEQLALEFVKRHGETTSDAAEVLTTAWHVYAYLFRDEHLPALGLPQVRPEHLRMLREAATFMALNKVELDGHISNIGPCWFFPAATSVVFDLDDEEGPDAGRGLPRHLVQRIPAHRVHQGPRRPRWTPCARLPVRA